MWPSFPAASGLMENGQCVSIRAGLAYESYSDRDSFLPWCAMTETSFPSTVTAHFATNRNWKKGEFGNDFYRGRPQEIQLGTVEVNQEEGDTGGGIWKADAITVFPERSRPAASDSRSQREWLQLGSTASFQTIRDAAARGKISDILVFIHGAGTSFSDAAETVVRMTELYSDPEKPLCPFYFSYPANGYSDPINYLADRDDADLSGPAMARSFGKLVNFLTTHKFTEPCGQRIHLLAHSLGNFALRKAVTTIFSNGAYRTARLFDTVFLAHADEDVDALVNPDKMRHLTRLTDRIVVYYDSTDKLLRLSDVVHMDRLGQKGPDPFPGPVVNGCEISAVDCSEVSFDVLRDDQRHRHYIGASAVVDDIRAMMRGQIPSGRKPQAKEGFFRL